MVRGWTVALLAVLALGVSACGDDDADESSSAQNPGIAAAVRALSSTTPRVACAAFSDKLLRRMFRSARNCERETRFEIESLQLLRLRETTALLNADENGQRARAHFRYAIEGESYDGYLRLRRDGGDWKVDYIEPAFLRASLGHPANLKAVDKTLPGVYSARAARCVENLYDELSDDEVVALSDAMSRGDDEASDREFDRVERCVVSDGGRSMKSGVFGLALRQALVESGLGETIADCAVKSLPDDVIDQAAGDKGREPPARVQRALRSAIADCSRGVA